MAAHPTTLSWNRGTPCIAFSGSRRIAIGVLAHVALKSKALFDRAAQGGPLIILDSSTSELIEVDFRGSADDVLRRIPIYIGAPTDHSQPPTETVRGPGRPRLGVIAREVTLLPRHWDWLNGQPGGASVALRKLVEEARKNNEGNDRRRRAREAAYRFMSTMAGNRPGFEEAARALFAGERKRFDRIVDRWPTGIRAQARKLAVESFEAATKRFRAAKESRPSPPEV